MNKVAYENEQVPDVTLARFCVYESLLNSIINAAPIRAPA